MENTLLNFLWLVFNNLFIDFFTIMCWYKCIGEKYKISKLLILTLVVALITSSFDIFFSNFIRIIAIFIFLILICKFTVTKSYKESTILVIISQLLAWISEFSFAIILSLFYGDKVQSVSQTPLVYFILTVYISLSFIILLKKQIPQKTFKLLNNEYSHSNSYDSLKYSLIIIAIIIISTIESYMELPLTIILITNVIMAILFVRIVINSTKIKANFNKISSKYETSISSLKEYEVMIDKFRVETHENKNEFLTVRNMIKNNLEGAIKYIDKLVDNKIKDSNKIMKKTAKIPSGGLKATIYSKLCLMDKLKIKYKLNIARDVHTTDLINLDDDLVLKICKILGVFLDNAIEAVKNIKEKEIFVEIYSMDGNLCIDITNNFRGSIDLNKISEQKYTTKGEGHGYGLSLVDKLLKEEPERLENEKSISGDTFTQMLKIKM